MLFSWFLKTKRNPEELLWFPTIQGLDAPPGPFPAFSCQVHRLDLFINGLGGREIRQYGPQTKYFKITSSTKLWRQVKCCHQGTLIRDSASRVFIRDYPCRNPLPITYQNSILSEGKQVCNINTSFVHHLGSVRQPVREWWETPQVSRHQPRISLASRPF